MGLTQSIARTLDLTTIPKTPQQTDQQTSNLKLEAQKIKEFFGNLEDWPKWKNRTECAFDGSGYENILTNEEFAAENPKMNRIVYSQLAVATVEGTAYHLVKQYEDMKDGYAAWQSLLGWYDGDVIKHETAEVIRAKLESLKLTIGSSAESYINQFLNSMHELDKIEGERYSESHKIYLFLRSIEHPEFSTTVTYLRNGNAKLYDCIHTIRKTERDLIEKRVKKRKLKDTIRRLSVNSMEDDSDDDTPVRKSSKKRRVRRVKEISTNKKGMIHVPKREWFDELTDEDKAFVQAWNAKIKHNESTDELALPNGLTIVNKARRVTPEKVAESPLSKKKKSSETPSAKKKIRFNLDANEVTEICEDKE